MILSKNSINQKLPLKGVSGGELHFLYRFSLIRDTPLNVLAVGTNFNVIIKAPSPIIKGPQIKIL